MKESDEKNQIEESNGRSQRATPEANERTKWEDQKNPMEEPNEPKDCSGSPVQGTQSQLAHTA